MPDYEYTATITLPSDEIKEAVFRVLDGTVQHLQNEHSYGEEDTDDD